MKKKEYIKPSAKAIDLSNTDIICTSGAKSTMNFSDDVGECDDEDLSDVWGKQW